MVNGSATKVQWAFETVYACINELDGSYELPIMTNQVEIESEAFKWVPDKKSSGLITGGKTDSALRTMGVKAEGSLSTLAKYDEVGNWLYAASGVEDNIITPSGATLAREHTFTSVDSDSFLPSLVFTVGESVTAQAYVGNIIDSITLEGSSGDQLSVDMSFVGYNEIPGTINPSAVKSTAKSFRFSDAIVKIGLSTIEATNAKFELKNNHEQIQTSVTGLYMNRPTVGKREVSVSIEGLYDTVMETIRQSYWKTDDAISVTLNYVSDELIEEGYPYSLSITIPYAQISETAKPNTSGGETLKQNVTLKALENGTDELYTIKLINTRNTKYNA